MSSIERFGSGRGVRRARRFARLVLTVVLAAAGVVWLDYEGAEGLRQLLQLFYGTPHERYAASLERNGIAETAAGRAWLDSAERALTDAERVRLPRRESITFDRDQPTAAAFAVSLRRGQRYVAETAVREGDPAALFVDVFERDGASLRRVASAAPDEHSVVLDLRKDGDYLIRVQPELEKALDVTLTLRAEPTLRIPVDRVQAASIQSFFGDSRDRGTRDHQGVDIFAKRGTPVLAASDGIVTKVGTNRLGGNVVWVMRPMRGERLYYAHLDRQLVTPGTFVKAGDVIGTVGNTGNARFTPSHLHFGIYARGGAVDPLPYISTPRPTRATRAADASFHPRFPPSAMRAGMDRPSRRGEGHVHSDS